MLYEEGTESLGQIAGGAFYGRVTNSYMKGQRTWGYQSSTVSGTAVTYNVSTFCSSSSPMLNYGMKLPGSTSINGGFPILNWE